MHRIEVDKYNSGIPRIKIYKLYYYIIIGYFCPKITSILLSSNNINKDYYYEYIISFFYDMQIFFIVKNINRLEVNFQNKITYNFIYINKYYMQKIIKKYYCGVSIKNIYERKYFNSARVHKYYNFCVDN